MAVIVKHNAEFEDNGRGYTPDLWAPMQSAMDAVRHGDLSQGFGYETDFTTGLQGISDWTLTDTTPTSGTATFAMDDASGGVALLDAGTTAEGEGGQIQLGGTTGEMYIPTADQTIGFEVRLKCSDIATGPEFFAGLSVIDTTIIASSANSSANHIGWESVSDDGILLLYGEKAGTRPTGLTTHTLVEDTYVRLGFRVNGVTDVEHWVNGVKIATTLVTANIPIVEMVPSFVIQSDGTTDSIMHIDHMRVFQKLTAGIH